MHPARTAKVWLYVHKAKRQEKSFWKKINPSLLFRSWQFWRFFSLSLCWNIAFLHWLCHTMSQPYHYARRLSDWKFSISVYIPNALQCCWFPQNLAVQWLSLLLHHTSPTYHFVAFLVVPFALAFSLRSFFYFFFMSYLVDCSLLLPKTVFTLFSEALCSCSPACHRGDAGVLQPSQSHREERARTQLSTAAPEAEYCKTATYRNH